MSMLLDLIGRPQPVDRDKPVVANAHVVRIIGGSIDAAGDVADESELMS